MLIMFIFIFSSHSTILYHHESEAPRNLSEEQDLICITYTGKDNLFFDLLGEKRRGEKERGGQRWEKLLSKPNFIKQNNTKYVNTAKNIGYKMCNPIYM